MRLIASHTRMPSHRLRGLPANTRPCILPALCSSSLISRPLSSILIDTPPTSLDEGHIEPLKPRVELNYHIKMPVLSVV